MTDGCQKSLKEEATCETQVLGKGKLTLLQAWWGPEGG
jgi:hypothetical protein